MAFSHLMAFLQDAAPAADGSSQNMVKIISGVLALVLVGIIVMRRRGGSKKKDEDDF